ncbi:hypothetical protein JJJ17_04840 [Paracoccus caeni]|uniref:DUF726 domain-containing protein n=1 Tax=Paracoccus caeni TaxID=657651 RepID=A0A934SIU5_9RHOB|nr:hypothetical protein [Paracoccus caeni]MBK4215248.1 hypothetical protein [Paracoccus caeni]
MPVIRINAPERPPAELLRLAQALPPNAPIVVMIHGYRYSPATPSHDPHRHILSLDPEPALRRSLSWPRALGFGSGHADEGLALAFGWEARGRLADAYARAGAAGGDLAALISEVAGAAGRPVAVIGHSLGARVALQALHHADPGSIGRAILLAGAEFRDSAADAIASEAGNRAEILNITSRENDIFDFGIELWLGRGRRRVLGFGLDQPARNWIDLQIDCKDSLKALELLGFPVEWAPLRLSHWTPYLRQGLFDFYRTALRHPWALPFPMLKARLPGATEPRWSRLLARPANVRGMRV